MLGEMASLGSWRLSKRKNFISTSALVLCHWGYMRNSLKRSTVLLTLIEWIRSLPFEMPSDFFCTYTYTKYKRATNTDIFKRCKVREFKIHWKKKLEITIGGRGNVCGMERNKNPKERSKPPGNKKCYLSCTIFNCSFPSCIFSMKQSLSSVSPYHLCPSLFTRLSLLAVGFLFWNCPNNERMLTALWHILFHTGSQDQGLRTPIILVKHEIRGIKKNTEN